jgi:hypothetical protein
MHYVRNTHLRRARMKNGDAQIAHLRHYISHYRVIEDACLSAFPISIQQRHEKLERVSHYKTHPRPLSASPISIQIAS